MKARPNKLDPFASRLDEWEAEGKTLGEMQAALKEDGCAVAASQLSVYLARRREARMEEQLFAQIASGGRMNKELESAYQKNPAPEIEQLIRVSKTLIMTLQVQGAANPKLLSLANSYLQTVLGYLSGKTKAELEERKIGLSEQKYRDQVQERKRAIEAELNRAKSSGGISAETRELIERELKLL